MLSENVYFRRAVLNLCRVLVLQKVIYNTHICSSISCYVPEIVISQNLEHVI
jgi:hypothetical protein